MLKEKNNIFLIFMLIVIFFVIISAFIIEYRLGHQPCKLCLYERIPYFLSIFLIIKIIYFKKYEKITLIFLSLIFLISTILAFYHLGIEQGFFNESFICETKNLSNTLSKEELLAELKKNTISCKELNFKIFGLSLASINIIFSLIISVIFLKLFINYGKN